MKLCLRIKHSNPMLHLIPHYRHRRIQLAIIAVRMYLNLLMWLKMWTSLLIRRLILQMFHNLKIRLRRLTIRHKTRHCRIKLHLLIFQALLWIRLYQSILRIRLYLQINHSWIRQRQTLPSQIIRLPTKLLQWILLQTPLKIAQVSLPRKYRKTSILRPSRPRCLQP